MNLKNTSDFSLLFAFLAYAIFGFSFIFSKQALAITTPFVLLAVRFTVAFLLLNGLLLTKIFHLDFKGKPIKPLLLLGFLQPILYFICENYGIMLLPTSIIGTILAMVPIVSFIAGFIFLNEKVSLFQILCAVCSVLGVSITTLGHNSGNFSWMGFVLLIAAVCSTSLYNVLSKGISNWFNAFERTYIMFALGSVTFCTIALLQSRNQMRELVIAPLLNLDFWISIIYLAAISSVGAFLMLNYAMTHLGVANASIFANITTVITILAGVFILKEAFGFFQILGSVIIVASAYGVNRPSKKSSA